MTNTNTITIEVSTIAGKPGWYRTTLDGQTVATSRVPFYASARALMAAGHPANARLEMRWTGKALVSLSGVLGRAAKLTVTERDGGGLRVEKYRPGPAMRAAA